MVHIIVRNTCLHGLSATRQPQLLAKNRTSSIMGRPAASEINKRVAVKLANLVTQSADSKNSTIARCGLCSLYNLLRSVRPEIARNFNEGPRDGISEVEFNKALQANPVFSPSFS